MESTIANRFILVALTVILLLGFSQARAQTGVKVKPKPKAPSVSKNEREKIETIVREYLLKNPSVIREAMMALEAQEEEARQQNVAINLKKLKTEIYSDPDSPVAGNPKGDVTIVVFFDYNCGYCKTTLPELTALISKDPSLRVVYKELPILGPQSQVAAQAALAAHRQGKYSEFHNALIETEGASDDEIKSVSDRLGLNYAMLKKDMEDPNLNESLNNNQTLALSLGISGTPAYLIGDQIIPGAIDSKSLTRLVAEERAKLVKRIKTTADSEK